VSDIHRIVTNIFKLSQPGLAISGGVDSMAMAALCSDLQKEPILHGLVHRHTHFKFKAFIVDHSARIGSGHEAADVKQLICSRQGKYYDKQASTQLRSHST
jgi:tRNA(Ile)-lysidine synthase TilS/MesJ